MCGWFAYTLHALAGVIKWDYRTTTNQKNMVTAFWQLLTGEASKPLLVQVLLMKVPVQSKTWIRIVMCKTGPACSLVKRLVNWQDLSMTSECTLQDWQLGFTAWQAEFQVPLSWNTRAQSVDIMCFADSTSKSFIGRYKPFVNVEWRGMAGLQNEA